MLKRKIVCCLLLLPAAVLGVLIGIQYRQRFVLQQGIADKILRFHVLANSDSPEDQDLKLAVRDAVGSQMSVLLSEVADKAACETIVDSQMDEIVAEAERVIAEEGYDYSVQAYLAEVDFPVKEYGDYTFPAGRYEALEIVIGEGKGQNWWCVMYPNMCFSGSVYEIVDEEAKQELRAVLTEEEYEKVFASGNCEIRFKSQKLWEFLKTLEENWKSV